MHYFTSSWCNKAYARSNHQSHIYRNILNIICTFLQPADLIKHRLDLTINLIFTVISWIFRNMNTASKFAIFSVSGLKDEKLIKEQTYTKTEACKLYSGVFWIFLPNVIKIDLYNFELYRFKVGAFFWDTVP